MSVRPIWKRTMAALASGVLATALIAGCSVADISSSTDAVTATATTVSSSDDSDTTTVDGSVTATNLSTTDLTSLDTHYDSDDLSWDVSAEQTITLSDAGSTSSSSDVTVDGSTVTISAGGVYRISGSLSDGQIIVSADDSDSVVLILDGVDITSSTTSAIDIESADEAIVYTETGTTNTLEDSSTYADTDADADAALFSKVDLTLAGEGELDVTGNYKNAITSNDGLVIVSGTVNATSTVDDGIRGKDYVVIAGGDVSVTAADDGVKSDNEDDADRGWLLVSGGTLTVSAGDDAVKAYNEVEITDGTVTVTESNEGIEADVIAVAGGEVDVTSSDDAVNASDGSGSESMEAGDEMYYQTGGTVTLNAGGDGLDSNGSALISGGTLVVNGPEDDGNGALDVNGTLEVDGGTVLAAGSSGMAVAPSADSAQTFVQYTADSALEAGTVVQIADSDGNVVATFVTEKSTASIVYSSDALTEGETYTIYTGGTADGTGLTTGTLDAATEVGTVTAGESTSAGMGGDMGGGMGGDMGGTAPDGQDA